MRYLGNKEKLLPFIESVIEKHNIQGEVFADLFAGSSAVGNHFKNRYRIVANDVMHFSAIISEARLQNDSTPTFEGFRAKYGGTPFEIYSNREYSAAPNHFVHATYSPKNGRGYFTEVNAVKIDGIRLALEDDYATGVLSHTEYVFLLASLIDSATRVSNTSGTYQAFFKFWEPRSLKAFTLIPVEVSSKGSSVGGHEVYSRDANQLAREISGDIAYIDPPYTVTQYANMYHVLETIARYDYPDVFGKTARRKNRTLSGYSNRVRALREFEDLFRQLDFEHILVSYSNQGIIPVDELIALAELFAADGQVHVEYQDYRTYATNNLSMKGDGEGLREILIYFRKDLSIRKSPLNYSGSKDGLIPALTRLLPKNISVLVDAMGGAGNVAANVVATERVVYNEINVRVHDVVALFLSHDPNYLVSRARSIVTEFGLEKKNREAYLRLRADYNANPTAIKLFVLQIYAFQNMIRLNSRGQMNTPVGNNEFNTNTVRRMQNFLPRTRNFEMRSGSYLELDPAQFPPDTLFYFDPPYFITRAEYNDGRRGLDGWDAESEASLLDYLRRVHDAGHKFMLSNVMEHKGRVHHLLEEWVASHGFYRQTVGATGIKYPRVEVVVTNYRV